MTANWRTSPCAGVTRLSSNLIEMTGKGANIFFRLCWQVVAPVLITVSQQARRISSAIIKKQTKKDINHNKDWEFCHLVAGYPDFLNHPVQTSSLWELCFSPLGSGGWVGHRHGLHHLDSSVRCSHTVGATRFISAGDICLTFAAEDFE